MDDLVKILIQHAKKYPLMEPVDAVKLIFQNEFGGGHLITGKEAGLNRLQEEYRNIIQSDDITLHEDIGNGIARINLSALDAYGLTIEKLNGSLCFIKHYSGTKLIYKETGCVRKANYEGILLLINYFYAPILTVI